MILPICEIIFFISQIRRACLDMTWKVFITLTFCFITEHIDYTDETSITEDENDIAVIFKSKQIIWSSFSLNYF